MVDFVFTQLLRHFPWRISYAKLKRKKPSLFPTLKVKESKLVTRSLAFHAERRKQQALGNVGNTFKKTTCLLNTSLFFQLCSDGNTPIPVCFFRGETSRAGQAQVIGRPVSELRSLRKSIFSSLGPKQPKESHWQYLFFIIFFFTRKDCSLRFG